MTCGHCAHFTNEIWPELKKKYVDTGQGPLHLPRVPARQSRRRRLDAGALRRRRQDLPAHRGAVREAEGVGVRRRQSGAAACSRSPSRRASRRNRFDKCLTDQKLLDDITAGRTRAADVFGVNGDADVLHQRQEARRRADDGGIRQDDRARPGRCAASRPLRRPPPPRRHRLQKDRASNGEPGRALVALLVATALAGCGGAGPLATGGLMTADEAPDPNRVAAAHDAGRQAARESRRGRFNPFGEQPAVPAGGREVIANPTVCRRDADRHAAGNVVRARRCAGDRSCSTPR